MHDSLTPFERRHGGYGFDENGFQKRDLVRFFLVDLILIAAIRLILALGIFPGPNAYVAAILASKVVLAAYLFWLIKTHRQALPETGAANWGKWWAWPAALAFYALSYPLLLYVDRINRFLMILVHAQLGWAYQPKTQEILLLIFEDILSQPIRLLLVLFTVLIGPIMEEFAFRGIGLDAYRRQGSAFAAVVSTSLLFGLFHFSLQLLLPLAVLGALFACVRLFSRSLWCAILVHCLHNAIALTLVARDLGVWTPGL